MSDWTQETLAKKAKLDLKDTTLTAFDDCMTKAGLDREEARLFVRALVPEEIAFMRVLVDHWIGTERPPSTT